MQILLSYTRSTFWIFGIVQIGTAVLFLAYSFFSPGLSRKITALVCLVVVCLGVFSCLAARALRQRKRFARAVVAANSVLALPLFPFGTIAGGFGLYWCFSSKAREIEPLNEAFEHQPKPGDGTNRGVQIAFPVLSIALWVGCLVAAGWWGRKHGLPEVSPIDGLILLIVAEWIVDLFHELGHAVAGWGAEMKLHLFRVGPIVAQRRRGRWEVKFSLLSIFMSTGGGVASAPLVLKDLRTRMMMHIAGGPVASLLTALIAFSALLALPGTAWEPWWKLAAVCAGLSATAAIVNAIPFAMAAGFSDGALIRQLRQGGPYADLHAALHMAAATTVSPLRPRDLDAGVLEQGLLSGGAAPEAGILPMILVVCAVDRGDAAAAAQYLEAALQRNPKPEAWGDPECVAEIAFYLAYLDGHTTRAVQWLAAAEELAAKQKVSLSASFDYWLAVTAIRLAQGNLGEAEAAWLQARQIADQAPPAGLYQYERTVLQNVHAGKWLRRQESPIS
jgi:hypothetical protein